jgi:hypothetical protein
VHFRRSQAGERFAPDLERTCLALLAEHQLYVLEADCNELTVVVEVEEFLARRLWLLAGQVLELIVTVEVQLDDLVWLACGRGPPVTGRLRRIRDADMVFSPSLS